MHSDVYYDRLVNLGFKTIVGPQSRILSRPVAPDENPLAVFQHGDDQLQIGKDLSNTGFLQTDELSTNLHGG